MQTSSPPAGLAAMDRPRRPADEQPGVHAVAVVSPDSRRSTFASATSFTWSSWCDDLGDGSGVRGR